MKNFQVVQMTQQYQTYISEERKTICVTKQHLVLKKWIVARKTFGLIHNCWLTFDEWDEN